MSNNEFKTTACMWLSIIAMLIFCQTLNQCMAMHDVERAIIQLKYKR